MATDTTEVTPTGAQLAAAVPARSRHLGLALVVISMAQLMLVLDELIVNTALPHIQQALHFSGTGLEWVVTGYAVTFGGLLMLGGRAGDILGRRRMFSAGILFFTLASLLGGFATSSWLLITARVLQGGGVGVVAGGLLTTYASWRWVFFVNVPIGLLLAFGARFAIPESQRYPRRWDLPGAITGTAGFALLIYGLTRGATGPDGISHWADTGTVLALGGAAAAIIAFVAIEARSRQPLPPLWIFASRNRTGVYLILLCLASTFFGMFFFLTLFTQVVWGIARCAAALPTCRSSAPSSWSPASAPSWFRALAHAYP